MRLALFCFLLLPALLSGQSLKPKNIIILIGDGMGLSQVSSSVLTDSTSAFKQFPVVGLSVTCSADKLITDSAAGATALATGKRTNNKWISISPDSVPLKTVHEFAKDKGKAAGVVVTSTVTNATPAAFLAHVTNRQQEVDIASQLANGPWDVVIGGGLKYFRPAIDSIKGISYPDRAALLASRGYSVFYQADSFLRVTPKTKYFALLAEDGMPRAKQRTYTLGDLTHKALQTLSVYKKGFILMVEGSQIDWTLHDHLTADFEAEMRDFNSALQTALAFAKADKNSLVLVTADHETGGLSINGGKTDSTQLKYEFTTKGHTAAMVGVFAFGPGAELFNGIQQNYEIGNKLIELLDK